MKGSVLSYVGLLFIKLAFIPNAELLGWVFIAILVDFITGIIKSKLLKIPITSSGFRKSVTKTLQYLGMIICGMILVNSIKEKNELTIWIHDGMLMFIIYVEVYSILENLYKMSPDSKAAVIVYKPLMALLSLSFSKNPFAKLAESETNKNLTILIAVMLLGVSCKTIAPQIDTSFEAKDTSITHYKPVDVAVKGADVVTPFDFSKFLVPTTGDFYIKNPEFKGLETKLDSILTIYAKAKFGKDTVKIFDQTNKVALKYWVDEFGKLQIQCSSKDQTIQLLVAEVTKLRKETEKKRETVIVKEMPKWGWFIIGCAGVLSLFGLIVLLLLIFRLIK
jgi:phage-related holin